MNLDLGLSEQQGLFQEALRRYFEQNLPLDRLRACIESGPAVDQALWRGLVDLGVCGILVPEEHGGSGLTLLDAALASESLGAFAVPLPFAGAAVMASRALLGSGSPDLQREWLPRVVDGQARFSVAFPASISGQTGGGSVHIDSGHLNGRIDAVLDGSAATHLIVYLPDGHAALVDTKAAGVSIESYRSVDRTRRNANVTFEGAPMQMLDAAVEPIKAMRQVLYVGRLMLAADTLGAAQTMMNRAVAYAKERVQFNRPIGSFQGVKYMCADMVTQLEPCRAFAWQAAQALDSEDTLESRVAALQAKAHISDVGREVSRMAIEVHGGMGFTDLLGLHYWFKRISLNRQLLGSAEQCRQEAAWVQGWTPHPASVAPPG